MLLLGLWLVSLLHCVREVWWVTVGAGILPHVEFFEEPLHERTGYWCAGNDARAQVTAVELRWLFEAEDRLEHGGDAVQGSTLLIGDGMECCERVEGLGGEDDLRAMRDDGEHAEDEPEAVEERGRAAEDIEGGEAHAIADEAGVVDEVAVGIG